MRRFGGILIALGVVALSAPLTADAAPGDVFVADYSLGGGAVVFVNPQSGDQRVVASGGNLAYTLGVAITSTGDVIATNLGGAAATVVRVNPRSGAQSLVTSAGNLKQPFGVALLSSGDAMVADAGGALDATVDGAIVRVNPGSGTQTLLASAGNLVNPTGVAVDSSSTGGDLYVSDLGPTTGAGDGKIVRVNPNTGAQALVAQGGNLDNPSGIAVGPGGDLLVADFGVSVSGGADGKLLKVTKSGGQSILASGGLEDVGGVAAPPKGVSQSDAVITDLGPSQGSGIADGRVLRVALANGAQSPLSNGQNLQNPFGVAIEADAVAPEITNLKVSPRAVTTSVGAEAAKKGGRFVYNLSEAANVLIEVERARQGRKVGGKCKRKTKKNRRKPKCTRYTIYTDTEVDGKQGANANKFRQKIGGRKLKRGNYRATLTASDAAGNVSLPKTAKFSVKKAKRKRRR